MRSSREISPTGLRRRFQFHLGLDELPLLEAAVREHGSVQEAVLAGLRAQALQRLQPLQPRQPRLEAPEGGESEPADQPGGEHTARARRASTERVSADGAEQRHGGETVELRSADAARVLGVRVATVRERLKRGTLTGRRVNGLWRVEVSRARVNESGVLLSPAGAAVALGVRPATVTARCKRGVYPNAREHESGWWIPASELGL